MLSTRDLEIWHGIRLQKLRRAFSQHSSAPVRWLPMRKIFHRGLTTGERVSWAAIGRAEFVFRRIYLFVFQGNSVQDAI